MRAHEVASEANERNAIPRRADGYDRYGLGDRTLGELHQERRDLATGLALLTNDSAARAPMRARLDAVDTELGRRPEQPRTAGQS